MPRTSRTHEVGDVKVWRNGTYTSLRMHPRRQLETLDNGRDQERVIMTPRNRSGTCRSVIHDTGASKGPTEGLNRRAQWKVPCDRSKLRTRNPSSVESRIRERMRVVDSLPALPTRASGVLRQRNS